MFGCVVAGRLVQTNLTQVDPYKYIFELPDAQSINHIVVFMTGAQAFPPNYAATVHFLWPSSQNSWQFLGMISNEKPSAIFKLSSQRPTVSSTGAFDSIDMIDADSPSIVAQLGISIEPIETVQAQIEVLKQQQQQQNTMNSSANNSNTNISNTSSNALVVAAKSSDISNLALKLLEHLYNYCASFAITPTSSMNGLMSNIDTSKGEAYVPVKILQEWYLTIQRKLKADPTANFLNS